MHGDCPGIDDNAAAAFVDGALDAAARAEIEQRIDACPTCRRQVSELMRVRSAVPEPDRIARYEVRGVLGEGGMGVVLRAWDPELEREVAVKLVRGESPDGALRLAREARAMAKLQHPAVLTVYDAGVVGAEVFVVMELVDGETLADWFATRRPWRAVVDRCKIAGSGLAAAHAAGLVHRDFKPHNVLCAKDGRVLVADFGLARASPGVADVTSAVTSTGGIVGTPAYMAPEQHLGEAIGPAADQFALAATIYEGVYGQRPFGGNTLAALISELLSGKVRPPPAATDVPRAIRAVIERGLARDPAARWPSVRAMLDALDAPPPTKRPWWALAALPVLALIAWLAWPHGTAARASAPAPAATLAPPDAAPPPSPQVGTTALFAADRLGHWNMLGDRVLIDAHARAWADDAQIESITATGADADGFVDVHAGGFVQYSYYSARLAKSKDLREIGRCEWVAYVKEGTEYSGPSTNSYCPTLVPPGEPRCSFAEIWRRAKRDGADATLPAQIVFTRLPPKDQVEWLFQSMGGAPFTKVYPDDC